ncbi:hypothetical protein [Legionella norrlandica]|uniref:hypothetical protein n=1 Tax=Legionella norrlandica TaxID=1498499 RepID=UPI001F4CC832|nr:hypothetical protein [Legionella norrlandica]
MESFLLGEKVPEGSMVVVDVSHKTKPQSGTPVETIARYTHNAEGNKFEIVQSPTRVPPVPGQDAPLEAKVNFYMAAAADMLAKRDGPPTKAKPIRLRGDNAEELQFLYTALVILGKNNPKMKFDRNAIKVHSAEFNPDNIKGLLGTGWFGTFNKNSFYSQVFTNKKQTSTYDIVHNKKEDYKAMVDEKFGGLKKRTEVDSQVIKQTSSSDQSEYKKQLNKVRETTQKTIKKEGPAPSETPRKGMSS